MTPEDFDNLFDQFRHTAYRLETLPAYDVGDIGDEAERIQAIRAGQPVPDRSVRTDPWMARIAVSTVVDGKQWRRVRVVDNPLTEYQQIELVALVEAQAVGDENFILDRAAATEDLPDMWLFDASTEHAQAVLMDYDDEGRWLGCTSIMDPSAVRRLTWMWDAAARAAVPLNVFIAGNRPRRV